MNEVQNKKRELVMAKELEQELAIVYGSIKRAKKDIE